MYLAFRLASLVLPLLPERFSYGLATFCADLAYRLHAPGRSAIIDNVRHVLGASASPPRLQRAVRDVFRTAAQNYVDLFLLPYTDLDKLNPQVQWEGLSHLENALAQGRGVIVAGAHLGSFDILSQLFGQRGTPMAILVEPLQHPGLFDLVARLRGSLGLRMLPATPGGIKAAIKLLRTGGIVGIACDRDIQRKGMRVDFFGEETSLPTGAVELALRTGAVVVPCFGLRLGFQRYSICCEPALDLPAGPQAHDRDPLLVRDAVMRLAQTLEHYLRRYPGQWVVFERIWPAEAAPIPARRTVRLGA